MQFGCPHMQERAFLFIGACKSWTFCRERKLVEIRLTATKIIIMLTLNHAIEASGYPHSQGGASEMRAVSNTCWDARLSGTVAGSEQDLRFRMHPSGHAT